MKLDLQEALEDLQLMREQDTEEGVANALFRVAVAYLQRRRIAEAAEPLEEAYYLCRKLENPMGRAEVCLVRAQLAQAEQDPAEAEKYAREALEVFEAQENKAGVLKALEPLAQALDQQSRPAEAAACLERALLITQEAEDHVGQILMVQRLAPLYRKMKRWTDALEAYSLMGRLADSAGDVQRVALALVGVGNMEAALEHNAQAAQAFLQAQEVFNQLGQISLAQQVREEALKLGLEPWINKHTSKE